ncbi:hypothetical protein ACFSUS_10105 [Spirosoma soli]|uniref:Uncharacterized protein n=1 Tax=Spirosoma soli TaxID=1770529 RepID=A0ABW5M1R8_9BACT
MKCTMFIASLLSLGFAVGASAQSNQAPVMQQSTSTEDTRQANPVKPQLQKVSKGDQLKMQQAQDTTRPKGRKQRRLRSDSLRRGGATRVDTIR